METEMCFVDVISLKLFAPELYLKKYYTIHIKRLFTDNEI